MGRFDQAARSACRVEPRVVARRLLRGVRQRLEVAEFHDTRITPLPGQRDRTVDSVVSLQDLDKADAPWLGILEFQAQANPDKLATTFVSVAHMYADVRHGPEHKGRYRVFAGFVYLRGKPDATQIDMTLTDANGVAVIGTCHLVGSWNVEEDDAGKAMDEVEADFAENWGLLFWVTLMQRAAEKDNRSRWLALAKRVPNLRQRADLFRIAQVFAELAGKLSEWNETFKGIDMEDSQLMLEWTAEARNEGFIQGQRETLLRQAQKRFKGDLTEEDKQMFATQNSTAVLREWLDAVVESKDYAAFRNFIRQ